MRRVRDAGRLAFGMRRAASLALFVATVTAHAARVAASEVPRGVVMPAAVGLVTTGGPRQAELDRSPAWRQFRARHGAWAALWNESAGSPHRAFGPAIPLGAANDRASVDRAVRRFVADHFELFQAPELETISIEKGGRVWYVHDRRLVNGIPVRFEDWEFRVSERGALMMFGVDQNGAAPVSGAGGARAGLVRSVARQAALRGLGHAAQARVEDGETAYLPVVTPAGAELRLAYEEEVAIDDPPQRWWTWVDATNGAVLWREDRVRQEIAGHVTAAVRVSTPSDPYTSVPLANLKVFVGSDSAITDSTGAYHAPASGTVSVTDSLTGLYCDVNDDVPPPGRITRSATDPATVDLAWDDTNAAEGERAAYYHVDRVHAFIKGIDPTFTGLDRPLPTRVNINATCNAFWNGTSINFYAAGGGCPNSATMADVVAHEYGHGINDLTYVAHGSPSGMLNSALHEGMADVNAAFFEDDPAMGKGFFGPGTVLRHDDNTARWPEDSNFDPHLTGEIIAGAFWDLREAVALPLATHLEHFAKYGIPDDLRNAGTAFSEYFTETLVADDDNGNLADGTPHASAIAAAFNAHGIGTGYFIHITHTPLADQPGSGDVPVTATITYDGPIGALDPGTLLLHYSINGAAYQTALMTPTGNPHEFSALVPGQAAAIVSYWISAGDSYGGRNTSPVSAPDRLVDQYIAGPAVKVLFHDMETDPDWTVGAPGDSAVTGVWEINDPIGTKVGNVQCSPEDDHTPGSGRICWITGWGQVADDPGVSDVDGGRTSLVTNVFNAALGQYPIIEYYRWYTNHLGDNPDSDYWRTYLSNDAGAHWVPVENTTLSNSAWQRVLFFIDDYLPPTATMRMKFVAQDSAGASLVEAGVDDFRLLSYVQDLAVGDPLPSARVALEAPAPNPATTRARLRFTLPAAHDVTLAVYDLEGRAVRTLARGALAAGVHTLEWDARDDHGRSLPPGPYFVRLEAGARVVRRVTVVR